jgi:hypothetical protein
MTEVIQSSTLLLSKTGTKSYHRCCDLVLMRMCVAMTLGLLCFWPGRVDMLQPLGHFLMVEQILGQLMIVVRLHCMRL